MKKILAVFLLTIFIVSALPCVSAGFAVNGQTSASVVKAEQWWTRGKPDLTLTSDDIVFSPASPTEGETVTITATIHNNGEGWAWRVEVGFYDEAGLIGIKKTGLIKAGGTGTASIEWTATPAGDHLIRVVADPNNKIDEGTKEGNNEASKTITVSGVGVLIPDLTLTPADIAFTPEAPAEGETVTIAATIYNMGNGTASDVVVGFYDGDPATGTSIGTDTIASIATGGTGVASVDWIAVFGIHDIYVVADPDDTIPEFNETNNQAFKPINVTEAPPPPPVVIEYELFIEIDYMPGHEPTPLVLDYIHDYYYERGIEVTFYVDDTDGISDVVPLTSDEWDATDGISDAEFWAIEETYNDGDDAYGTGDAIFGTAGVYSSKWKWVLFGTVYEDAPDVVMGYCYIIAQQVSRRRADMLGGNYIFVADEATDNWAGKNLQLKIGAEACVLMHEMGHSIGIGELRYSWWYGWVEDYCSDPTCVMSTLSTSNAGLYKDWHYCTDHWAQKDMDYYAK